MTAYEAEYALRKDWADCHVHLVGDPSEYTLSRDRTYLPGVARLRTLRDLAERCGVTKFVLVQPSFYGSNNSLLLSSLDELGADGRGVVVLKSSGYSASFYRKLTARGVRGIRANLYTPVTGEQASVVDYVTQAMRNALEGGWHVEVITQLTRLVELKDVIINAPVKVVLDHYGLPGRMRPSSSFGRQLVELLRLPHVWMKLSAPYRMSSDPVDLMPDSEWLKEIIAASAGERCVWGSDWPWTPVHVESSSPERAVPYRALEYRPLLLRFSEAVADPILLDRIMERNAKRLYGF